MNWETIIAMGIGYLAGACFMLGGVALGGFLVYRTKRDSHEPLFTAPLTAKDTGPQHYDDLDYGNDDEPQFDTSAMHRENTDKFLSQLDDKLGSPING